MKTIVVTLDKEHPDGEAILRAGEIIKAGGLVAFPTETVYGLGGDALNPESSRKIYAAKGRPSDNPLIVHICRWEDIYKIADPVPEIAQRLAARFWPGPLTMILNKTALVPKETTGGLDTVAVRFPSDSIAQRFICAAGGFVAAPSANTSGQTEPDAGAVCKRGHGREDRDDLRRRRGSRHWSGIYDRRPDWRHSDDPAPGLCDAKDAGRGCKSGGR